MCVTLLAKRTPPVSTCMVDQKNRSTFSCYSFILVSYWTYTFLQIFISSRDGLVKSAKKAIVKHITRIRRLPYMCCICTRRRGWYSCLSFPLLFRSRTAFLWVLNPALIVSVLFTGPSLPELIFMESYNPLDAIVPFFFWEGIELRMNDKKKKTMNKTEIFINCTSGWRLKRQTNGSAITVYGQKPMLDNSIEK